MKLFLKYQEIILRVGGGLLLLTGFIIHFWVVPPKGMSENERASANLARIEASVSGSSKNLQANKKADTSHFIKKLKETQKKQLEYLTIVSMVLGSLSLGYSFVKRKKRES